MLMIAYLRGHFKCKGQEKSSMFYDQLAAIVGKEHILTDEPMAAHTTFRVGGPADYLVSPESPEQVAAVVGLCRQQEVPFMVIGNGSNLLVSDAGYRGVLIKLLENYQEVTIHDRIIYAQAGALLSTIARKAARYTLTGMEFAAGIPGTIGGAMMMNAGAYGGEMKDIVSQVTVLDGEGRICQYSNADMQFGYRDSIVAHKDLTVLEVTLQLEVGEAEEIKAEMDRLAEQRTSKQPLEYPSAGSTFKRPEGYYAGALIQEAGLRGYQIGGAKVSEKHCGFVINSDHATAADVKALIDHIRQTVYENSGVMMTPEVRFVGEF